MKKSLRRALLAGVVVAAGVAVVPIVQASAAEACAPAWTSTAVYVGGNVASKGGNNYTAAYWNQNADPVTHNGPQYSGKEWKTGVPCGGGTTPTNPPTTTPTTKPTTKPPDHPDDGADDAAPHRWRRQEPGRLLRRVGRVRP